MQRGFFITLEGLDGSGKTTQINRLAAWLKKRASEEPRAPSFRRPGVPTDRFSSVGWRSGERVGSHEFVLTRQPGGTPTGDRIRALLLDSRSTALSPMAEMALMFADRAQAIAQVIQPALDAGKIVLCDRFTDSTEAYQGGGRQLGSQAVLELHRLLCSNLQPDLTLLLLPSLEASLARARRRNQRENAKFGQDENRFELEQDAFYRRVWEKYQEIAAREPARVVLIQGDLSIDEVHEQIVEAVSERLLTASPMA
jgi:dTMP kinase